MAEMCRDHSQTPVPPLSSSLFPLPLKQNSKRKLDDYLDPVLLHTISSRIGPTVMKEKQQMEKKVIFVDTNQRTEFEWPADRFGSVSQQSKSRDSWEEDDGARLFVPTRPSVNKRRRNGFPMWKVDDKQTRRIIANL